MAFVIASCTAKTKTQNDNSTAVETTVKGDGEKSTTASNTQNKSNTANGEISTTSKRDLEDLPDDIRQNGVENKDSPATTTTAKAKPPTTKKKNNQKTTIKQTTQTTTKSNNPYETPAVPID